MSWYSYEYHFQSQSMSTIFPMTKNLWAIDSFCLLVSYYIIWGLNEILMICLNFTLRILEKGHERDRCFWTYRGTLSSLQLCRLELLVGFVSWIAPSILEDVGVKLQNKYNLRNPYNNQRCLRRLMLLWLRWRGWWCSVRWRWCWNVKSL